MLRRQLLTLATAALLVITPLVSAQADEQESAQPVMVIMDYSSSMLEEDADSKGTSRIDAAKKAAKHLINNAPDEATMGLVVYGSKTPKKCDDITTVQKPGKVDKKALLKKIDKLKAVGETPIGASLMHAANEMKDIDEEKSIILVSDGEENCSEPPACEAAKDLAGQGIDLTVHTIGFKVNDKARKQLECIADATDGTYVTVDDADALQEELTIRTLRAFQGYATAGTPIEGAPKLHEAPAMVPGQYLDSLEKGESKTWTSKDGTTKYYKIGPIKPGEFAHFSATMIPEQKQSESASAPTKISVELVNGQGVRCSSDENLMLTSSELGHPLAAYARSPKFVQDSTIGCFADGTGEIFAKVTRSGELFKDEPMAVELRYVLEPAVDLTQLEEGVVVPDKPQSVTLTGTPEEILGGSSFNDAMPVEPGKIYADSVLVNEARYYKVHVGNGQKLNVRLTGGNNEDAAAQAINVTMFSAVRDEVRQLGPSRLMANLPNDVVTQNMITAVDQSNYDSLYGRSNYLAGDYYIVVYSDTWGSDRTGGAFDYDMAVEVTGTEKDFAGAAPIFESSQTPAESQEADSAAPSESAAASTPAATPSSDAATSQEAQSSEPTAAQATSGERALWPWFTGGLLGTALLLGAGSFLFRNRATSAHQAATTQIDPTVPGDR